MEMVQRGELHSIISDKRAATGGSQSLRDPLVSMDDEEHLLVDGIKGSRFRMKGIRSRRSSSRIAGLQ